MTDVASAASGVDSSAVSGMSVSSLLDKSEKRENENRKDAMSLVKDIERIPRPKPPELTEAPKSETTPMNGFGTAATFLATFGSMLTRRPLTNALNSSAEVMNAYKEQDTKKFEQAFNKWKIDTDNAWKMSNYQQELYKGLLNEKELVAKIIAGANKDETTRMAIESKTLDAHLKALSANTDKLNLTKIKQEEYERRIASGEDQTQAYDEIFNMTESKLKEKKDLEKEKKNFDYKTAKSTDFYPGTSMTVGAVKEKAAQYRLDSTVLSRGGLSKDDKEAIANVASAMDEEEGRSGGDTVASQASYKADSHSLMNMQKMTDAAESYEDTAKLNFENALKLAKNGGIPSDFGPWLNKWVQQGDTALGDPNIPPFSAALLTGANEFSKVMSGSTGAQGATDSSRAEAASMFRGAYDYKTLDNVIKKVAYVDMDNRKKMLDGRIQLIKDRIKDGGKSVKKSALKSVPLPPELTNDPDGTEVPDASGNIWIKKDKQLVPKDAASSTQ